MDVYGLIHTCTYKCQTSTQVQRGNSWALSHHGVLRFHLDSDVCSADLHHQHVGLHAHQRLHRLP